MGKGSEESGPQHDGCLEAAGALEPHTHLFSSVGNLGLESQEERSLKQRLLATSGYVLASLCVSPLETELTSAWPVLIATNNEAASELRTPCLWLLSLGVGWLAAEVSSNLPLYSHGCNLNTVSLPLYGGFAFQEHICLGLVYLW